MTLGTAQNPASVQLPPPDHLVADAASGPNEQLPRPFGRLVLLKRLAKGGMGEIYLAATRGIEGAERPCVVKTIREEHSADKSFRARFLDETRIQAQLAHPGVAQILEADTLDDERPYAVVEYVEGRHLGEVLLRSTQLGVRIEWPDVAAIGVCFADALAHVHERTDALGRPLAIAHRDLSPQNVMLGYAGDLKLIDFGTARGENRRCRTVSGIVFAKPGYVAPEVANQTPGGPAADIYALGVMLWELLAGRRFLKGDPVAHQARVAEGSLPLPLLIGEVGGPLAFDGILAKMTHFDPERRTQTARRAAQELAELLKQAPSLADGDRSVRGRIAHLMQKLYPAEPARSRADFARRVAQSRELFGKDGSASGRPGIPEPSPEPPALEEAASDLFLGTRYRAIRKLSEGPMGEVWEAEHVDLGRPAALKLLPLAIAQSGVARKRFRTEARVIARLEHPGLVKLHDFGMTLDGRPYFAMELLAGETLASRLTRGPLTPPMAIDLAEQCLRALSAAHAAGVLHQDITASNLFLTPGDRVKLLDFGIASSLSEARDPSREGIIVGTPEYLSPEQAAGASVDVRSDLYSLGVVLYEMVTGRLPHPVSEGPSSLAALLTAKITQSPEPPSRFAPKIPKELEQLILSLLEREMDRRPRDAEAVLKKLSILRSSAPSPFSRRRNLRSGLAIAAAAAVVFGLFWARRSAESFEFKANEMALPEAPAPREVSPSAPEALDKDQAEEHTAIAQPQKAEVAQASQPEVAAPSASPSPETVSPVAKPSPLQGELERVGELLRRGQKIAAHHRMKEMRREHPKDPEVLDLFVKTAQAVKAWGEALRAQEERVALSDDPEAIVQLARLERLTLKGDPVRRLQKLLAISPGLRSAQELLSEYEKAALARR